MQKVYSSLLFADYIICIDMAQSNQSINQSILILDTFERVVEDNNE
jgi:hypothetical protein